MKSVAGVKKDQRIKKKMTFSWQAAWESDRKTQSSTRCANINFISIDFFCLRDGLCRKEETARNLSSGRSNSYR